MAETFRILVINPGSTSTKVGVFENEACLFEERIAYRAEELAIFRKAADQYDLRKKDIMDCLEEKGYRVSEMDAIAARGAPLPPLRSGAYCVGKAMADRLRNNPIMEHASNLAPIIAYEFSEMYGIPSYIYDGVTTDELSALARVSGMPEIPRVSLCHALNMKAAARKGAESIGLAYSDANIVVAHLGGGITISLHEQGRMCDILSDDEGPFSPEGSGRVPCRKLIELCYSGQYDRQEMLRKLRGRGGLTAYAGTNDVEELEKRIGEDDEDARLWLEAMAYQVAKGIGEMAVAASGDVDMIVLTGGMAGSERITGWIERRVAFIADVLNIPGEMEMESLAAGVLRVLKGVEEAYEYR